MNENILSEALLPVLQSKSMKQTLPPARLRAIQVATLLLAVQALALLTLGVLNLHDLGITANLTPEQTIDLLFKGLTSSFVFIALACISLVATINFWRIDEIALTMGMLTQGLTLLTALIIFFEGVIAHIYSYTMMAYGLFMVIYLHMPDIVGTMRQPDKETESNR